MNSTDIPRELRRLYEAGAWDLPSAPPLGVAPDLRKSHRRRNFALASTAAVLAMVVVVVVQDRRVQTAPRSSELRAGPAATSVRVQFTAFDLLETSSRARVVACYSSDGPFPPTRCSGVTVVRDAVIDSVEGVRLPGGRRLWGMLTITGTWDGHVVRPTHVEKATGRLSAEPTRCSEGACFVGTAVDDPNAVVRRISLESALLRRQGIHLLAAEVIARTPTVEIDFADQGAVAYLRSRYGAVTVIGWLKPV